MYAMALIAGLQCWAGHRQSLVGQGCAACAARSVGQATSWCLPKGCTRPVPAACLLILVWGERGASWGRTLQTFLALQLRHHHARHHRQTWSHDHVQWCLGLCLEPVRAPVLVLRRAGDRVYQHDICWVGLFDLEMGAGWKSHGVHALVAWRNLASQAAPRPADVSTLNTTRSNTTPCVVSKLS